MGRPNKSLAKDSPDLPVTIKEWTNRKITPPMMNKTPIVFNSFLTIIFIFISFLFGGDTKSSPQRWLSPPATLSDSSLNSALERAYCC